MAELDNLAPANSTPLDNAIYRMLAERFDVLDQDLQALLDPYRTPEQFLPFVGWAKRPPVWDNTWSLPKKRHVIGTEFDRKKLVGTKEAIRQYLDLVDATLVETVVSPQGFYASPNLTREQQDEWIRQMPELRIAVGSKPGLAAEDDLFADDGFADHCFVAVDDGPELRGRFAFIRQYGVDTPVRVATYNKTVGTSKAVEFERITTPGVSTMGWFVDESAADDERYTDAEERAPTAYTIRLDTSYVHDTFHLGLSTVMPGLEPISPRFERISDVGFDPLGFFADASFSHEHFVTLEEAALMLADRVYLHDPSVASPMTEGISFVDVDRVGMPPYTAELLIDLHLSEPLPAMFADDTVAGEDYAVPEDRTKIDNAMDAVVAGKSLRDTVLVSFETLRPVTMGDPIDFTTEYADWVPAHL